MWPDLRNRGQAKIEVQIELQKKIKKSSFQLVTSINSMTKYAKEQALYVLDSTVIVGYTFWKTSVWVGKWMGGYEIFRN